MHLPVLWLMLALLTKSIASGEQTCSTTFTSKGTFYKVPDFGEPHCTPHWIDADNNTTLANGDEKNDSLVVSSNITTLHTYGCHNAVTYVLDCYPSTRLNKMVRCVANCSESAGFSGTPDNTEGNPELVHVTNGVCLCNSTLSYTSSLCLYVWVDNVSCKGRRLTTNPVQSVQGSAFAVSKYVGTINHWVIPVICACIFMTFCAIGGVIYCCRRQCCNQNGL